MLPQITQIVLNSSKKKNVASDEQFNTAGLWETLREQQSMGKVRHLGISISSSRENLPQTDSATEVGASAIQVVYNRLERGPEQRVLPSCQRQNLGVLARVPLASGFLSGKYKPGAKFEKGDTRAGYTQELLDEKLREAQRIEKEEVPPGVPMSRWALAWCLKHPAVTAVIPGCKSVEQVEANAAAAELSMVEERIHRE